MWKLTEIYADWQFGIMSFGQQIAAFSRGAHEKEERVCS